MSTKQRAERSGCSVESHRGRLRLRFRWRAQQVHRATGLPDTPANRVRVRKLADAVGALIRVGRDPVAFLDDVTRAAGPVSPTTLSGPTVADYSQTWIAERTPLVRKAQARDYRRHFRSYIIPGLGTVALGALRPADVRGLQSDLLGRGLSVKTVKNVLSGSLRAMILQAMADELVTRDVFAGLTWPEWTPPDPDPFDPDERDRILTWFKTKRFGFHAGRGRAMARTLPHPLFHAYVHTLLWTGLRPSEASGLQWGDVDLKRSRFHVRRSRHLYSYNAPKTPSARRTVELFPESVRVLRAIQPLHGRPDAPVFTTTTGTPIEPKTFSAHFYRCLRALGIRQRGIYACKDTFVTTALQAGVKIAWLEAQTGVRYETLRKHYGKWFPSEDSEELRKFATADPGLFRGEFVPPGGTTGEKAQRSSVRGGGLEPDGGARQVWIFQGFTSAGIRR